MLLTEAPPDELYAPSWKNPDTSCAPSSIYSRRTSSLAYQNKSCWYVCTLLFLSKMHVIGAWASCS